MENIETKIVIEAVKWWRCKRPPCLSESDHISNPTIDCYRDSEKRLAELVSKLIASKQD